MERNKRKTKKNKQNKTIKNLKKEIQSLLDKHVTRSYSRKQLIKKLKLRKKVAKSNFSMVLQELINEGKISKLKNGSFISAKKMEYIEGKVDHVNARYSYVMPDSQDQDVWVKASNMKDAIDGDRVKIMVFPTRRHGSRPEGKVVEILERTHEEFVGRIEVHKEFAFVIPDNKNIYNDVFVRPRDLNKAKTDDKVIVKVIDWAPQEKNPVGKVIRILGKTGENEAEIHSIMAEFNLPFEFPSEVSALANKIDTGITKSEISQRKDMRSITTFTIDPEDAKDFDDALSIKKLENGNYEVGIHIADVTHYLKPGTPIDKEAFKRATSVYLVDRTIPMLPEKLSNELCSLRPHEDKLTFSAVFELDDNAHIVNEWFGRTIIHSDHRFSYEEAQEIIENIKGNYARELTILNELTLKLRAERFMRGSINFETQEFKFKLDEKGVPLEVIPKVRKDAHKLIEEFMLLANKRVAEFVFHKVSGNKKSKKDRPTFVYRTHDYPDPDKLKAFSIFARKFGHKLNIDEDSIAQSLNQLIETIEGKPEENVLQILAIRTMAKAIYTTDAKEHFGLAFPHYTHFTSPIRRYPDVMVHRLLFQYLNGRESPQKSKYEEQCKHSSEKEKNASDAERASVKYKQVEFMSTHIGKTFEGIISGVTEWGIFVEIIETRCEGMARLSEMTDDYYEFDEDNYRVIGKNNKKIYTLGDHVMVLVVKTDIDRRTIDLEIAEDV